MPNPYSTQIVKSLNEFLDSQTTLDVYRPEHGTIVFPRLKKGSVENLACLLHETSVVPGRFFDTPQHFRVGIGGDSEMMRTAFEPLSLPLDEYARSV